MGLFTILNAKKTIKKYSSNSIVIFSEGDIYYTTNKPIIDELINMVNVLYITIDKNDKLLGFKHEKFHPIFLEFSFFGKLVLGALKGKLFVTTTPSLNIIPLMKSPFMQQYIYIMHSPTDIHYYQRYSFDYYDSIVCCGDYQINTLNYLEEMRNTQIKEKISLGLPYYDLYMKEALNCACDSENTILIAPSWGDNNFLKYIYYDLFEVVFKAGFNIIYRPHPTSIKHEFKDVKNIINKYQNGYDGLKFTFDKNLSPVSSIMQSTGLISAHSGMVIDYLVLKNGSILYYNISRDINNLENIDVNSKPWDESIIEERAYIITSKEALEKDLLTIKQNQSINKKIDDIKNIGTTAKKIADYLYNKMVNDKGDIL